MLYLFGCLVSSIAFGILLICKIVDMVHSTNTDKLKDYKLILSISVSGLAISWWLFFMDLINIIGYYPRITAFWRMPLLLLKRSNLKMRKIQNFFSYFRASELSTNQIFELFDSSNKGKDISPYKIEYSFNKDILSECELEAYEELLRLDNKVALLSKNGKVAALIGYISPQK